jgi:hypothetical protein
MLNPRGPRHERLAVFDVPPGIIVSQTDPALIEGGYISAVRFELDPMPLSGGPVRGIKSGSGHQG